MEESKEVWKAIKAESEQTLNQLKENIARLHMVSSEETDEEQVKQIDIQVNVKGTKIAAIVDCGADVDYVNEALVQTDGLRDHEGRRMSTERLRWKRESEPTILKTSIEFRYQGQRMRQRFRVVKRNGRRSNGIRITMAAETEPGYRLEERERSP